MKVAFVEWVDAFSYDDCRSPLSVFPTHRVLTPGILVQEIEETNGHIVLCRDFFPGGNDIAPLARYTISIPRGMIQRMVIKDWDKIMQEAEKGRVRKP